MSAEMFQLEGKVTVVTGGSRGIGKMIASGLLSAGAEVFLSSRKISDLEDTVNELSHLGKVHAVAADLGTTEGITTLVKNIEARTAAVHTLFNNAGANWGAPFDEFPETAWDKVLDVNVKGPFLLTQALLPLLKNASTPGDPARVINTGSIDGLRPPGHGINNFSYSASKAALHMMTRHLAGEFAPDILVNAIAPGLFESKMTKEILEIGETAVAQHIPLQRIGKPADMAGIAVFLASAASAYITGTVIPVDGGLSQFWNERC